MSPDVALSLTAADGRQVQVGLHAALEAVAAVLDSATPYTCPTRTGPVTWMMWRGRVLTKAARELALHTNQSATARKLGTSRQNVHNWQTGTVPDLVWVQKIHETLGIPASWWTVPAGLSASGSAHP